MFSSKVDKMLEISQAEVRYYLNYSPETGIFRRIRYYGERCNKSINKIVGTDCNGYLKIGIGQNEYKSHRLAWIYVHGELGQDEVIDHINGIKHDNRIANLRKCTYAQNAQNIVKIQKDNTTGFLGVCYDKSKRKYMASIKVNSKQKFLGRYNTPEEASEAYLRAKRQYHEFCTI